MMTQPVLLSLCAIMALSACSASTKSDYNSNLFSVIDASKSLDETQMQIYVASAESQLLLLEQQASKRCISGQLAIAQTLLTKATQEHNAKMEKDAFITLVEFDRQMRKVRCINQHISGQLGCGYTNKKIVLKRWYDEGEFAQCDSPAKTKVSIEKQHIVITETLYDFNQAEIKPIYYQSLNKLAELIKTYSKSKLVISGHTDSKGSSAYNIQLSKRRAQSVADYFINKGIEASQIVIEKNGEKYIREVEQSEVSRVFNRYTSITLFLDTSDKNNI